MTNGEYTVTNQIAVFRTITLRSVNGRDATFINGRYPAYTNRCLNITAAATVDGFTITNFYCTVGGSEAGSGAGVRVTAGGIVRNCRLAYNRHPSEAGGGALVIQNSLLSNCVVHGNTAYEFGGGVYVYSGGRMSDCTIYDNIQTQRNTAYKGGGGVALASVSSRVDRCTISSNLSFSRGGGVFITGGILSNCLIEGNSNNYVGNGLYGGGVSLEATTNALMADTTVRGNLTVNCGGGQNLQEGRVERCLLAGNTAASVNGFGGGAYMQGGVLVDSTVASNVCQRKGAGLSFSTMRAMVTNCLIGFNTAYDDGGGIYTWPTTATEIYNCRIISNQTLEIGGGAYLARAVILRNCLIAGNVATNVPKVGGGLVLNMIGAQTGWVESCTIVGNRGYYRGGGVHLMNVTNSLTNCIIYGNSVLSGPADRDLYAAAAGDTNAPAWCCSSATWMPPDRGNTTNAPVFQDAAGGNYRLAANSPGEDAGIALDWMAAWQDLDGRPRLDRLVQRPDMGAYERIKGGGLLLLR